MKLLVIRPQPGADATAARVQAAGHEALLLPLFGVEPIAWHLPPADNYDSLLLTSANAVRQAGQQLADLAHLPVIAVGAVTASAARKAGLRVSQTGDASAETLLADQRNCRLLWLAGEDRTEIAAPESVQMDIRIVYRSAILRIPADTGEMISSADYVLLHSARAAEHLASIAADQGADKSSISIAALSEKIALAAGRGWRSVRVAPQPNDAALLSCL